MTTPIAPDLAARLRAAGVDPERRGDPAEAWRRLYAHAGPAATLIDRYALEAATRGIDVADLADEDRRRLALEVLSTRDPAFTVAPDSARLREDPIVLVAYDRSWPRTFERWRACLAAGLAPLDVRIEHVGSTAVPGLAAKPVIDISVGVPDVEAEAGYVPAIEAAGVALRSRETGHRYFRPAGSRPRTVQVHVSTRGGDFERAHLLFRDFLRASASAATRYQAAKIDAARSFPRDRIAYNEAKSGLIRELLGTAEAWAGETGWSGGGPG